MSDNSLPPDDILRAAGWIPASRRTRRIQSRPRFGQYYWVDFPHDAYAPEFVGEHPGIVIRAAKKLDHDTCVVVPVTSKPQGESPHIHKLEVNPNPDGKANGVEAYVVCDHFYTVSICRLRPVVDPTGRAIFPKINESDLAGISKCVVRALQIILSAAEAQPPQPSSQPDAEPPPGPEKTGPGGRKILRLPGR